MLRAKAGDPITARAWNALVDAIKASIRGGPGIDVSRDAGGAVVISLREDPAPKIYPARVVAVLGPAAGEPASSANLGYRVARVGLSDDAAVDFEPQRVVGRIDYTGQVALVPAPVGSPGLIREWRSDAGDNIPYFEVWQEAPAVELACPDGEQAGGLDGLGGLGGLGGLTGAAGFVEVALAQTQGSEEVDASNRTHEVELEVTDLADVDADVTTAVPAWATHATVHVVAMGVGATPPLGQLTIGRSNTGANAVYEGTAAVTFGGDLGEAGRVGLKTGVDVVAVGHLHLKVTAPSTGTAIGSARAYVRFARAE